jgi:hypothetical protein
MNIGLITLHNSNNYGALLQVYATQETLRKMGHRCEIINFRRKPKSKFLTYFYNNICNRSFAIFRKERLQPMSRQYYSNDDLSELNDVFDCFVVGSDQVWRARWTKEIALRYFLDFATNDKLKISYASSFGIATWSETPEITPVVKELLNGFNAISVRENSGVEICREVFGVGATHVLDPSLLLTEKDYLPLIENYAPSLPRHYAAIFFLDRQGKGLLNEIKGYFKEVKGISSVDITIPKLLVGNKFLDWRPKKVRHWLYVLKNADCVITESFHCTAFSIIFKKKMVCIVNERKGVGRLQSLLKLIKAEHVLIYKHEISRERLSEILDAKMDYKQIGTLISQQREISLDFLKKALTT